MFNQSYVDNFTSPLGISPNRKPKGGIFSQAGRSISRQEDAIQHNYAYQHNRQQSDKNLRNNGIEDLRRARNEADFGALANSNPRLYNSVVNNLDKLNNNLERVDAYTNEIQMAKEKLYYDQRNVHNMNNLNKLNALEHKQHLQNQLTRIRQPVSQLNFSPMRAKQNPRNNDFKPEMSNTERELQLDLLDQFSASHSLDDQLSSLAQLAPNHRRQQRPILDDYQSFERPYNASFNAGYDANPFNGNSSTMSAPQFNPFPPQQYGPPPQQYPPYQYPPPPQYGFGAPPAENTELKLYMQKQNDLLERIGEKIEESRNNRSTRSDYRRDSLKGRLREYEKETELRLQMMKQQTMIENLQNNRDSQPNQRQHHDDSHKSQSQLPPDLMTPQALAQNFMQHLQPFQYQMDAFSNPFLTPQYNNPYGNGYGYPGADPYNPYGQYPYQPSSKKSDKKKKKKKKNRSDSSDESDDDSEKSESVDSRDSDKKSRKSKKSPKKDKKDKKDKKSGKKEKRKTKEEEAKEKEENKKKAKKNLKVILWSVAYPKIFQKDIDGKVVVRKQAQNEDVNEKLESFTQNFATWLMNITQEGFTKLFDDSKKNYDFVGLDFKKLSKSEMTKRMTEVKTKMKFLLDTLTSQTDKNELENSDLEFLADLCHGNAYVADKSISNFELMRIQFSSFGRTTNMTKDHSQMMIASLLIVRILAYQLVYKASEWNTKPKWTDQMLVNFKIVACLVYYITCSIWEEKLPIINQSPSALSIEPLTPLSMDIGIPPTEGKSDDPDMIIGTISRDQLAPLLQEDKQWVDTIKKVIVDWTEKIYKKVEDFRVKNPAKKYGALGDLPGNDEGNTKA